MSYTCPHQNCGITIDTEGGMKRHLTTVHNGFYQADLIKAGITPTGKDIARSLDGGHTSIDSVVSSAQETETSDEKQKQTQTETKRSKRQENADREEFERLRPQMVKRWKRRLRIPFSLWARIADDPNIALSEDELEEGAEMHIDFCAAMGWYKAGKIEAILDLTFWWGATALSRSELGQELIGKKSEPNPANSGRVQ